MIDDSDRGMVAERVPGTDLDSGSSVVERRQCDVAASRTDPGVGSVLDVRRVSAVLTDPDVSVGDRSSVERREIARVHATVTVIVVHPSCADGASWISASGIVARIARVAEGTSRSGTDVVIDVHSIG